jgi:hypothetical protein
MPKRFVSRVAAATAARSAWRRVGAAAEADGVRPRTPVTAIKAAESIVEERMALSRVTGRKPPGEPAASGEAAGSAAYCVAYVTATEAVTSRGKRQVRRDPVRTRLRRPVLVRSKR